MPYVDPGYGTLLLQALLSAVLGILFVGRNAIGAILRRLTRGRPKFPPRDPPGA